jgi:hypothetical protein
MDELIDAQAALQLLRSVSGGVASETEGCIRKGVMLVTAAAKRNSVMLTVVNRHTTILLTELEWSRYFLWTGEVGGTVYYVCTRTELGCTRQASASQ